MLRNLKARFVKPDSASPSAAGSELQRMTQRGSTNRRRGGCALAAYLSSLCCFSSLSPRLRERRSQSTPQPPLPAAAAVR
jgi:hypothetical protein